MNVEHSEPTEPEGPEEQAEPLSELLRIGKDEMNLAEFPMTSLSDRPIDGESRLRFEDQIYDAQKKKIITRKRIIEGSKEYGLPTATDDSVILALIQLTKLKNGFTSREVEFTRCELIKLLNWPNKGQSYDRITQSLHRVAAVTYHFENSWWDNRRKAWTTRIFGIIDTVELNDGRDTAGRADLFHSRIQWNQIVLDSFQAGYLRSLDFQIAMGLKHSISLRIYRFMGKRFHLRPKWSFDLKDFAYEHVGLSRSYEGGAQIARKLQPALTELEDVGFLEPLGKNKRFVKKGRDWSIRLVHKSVAPAGASAAPQAAESESESEAESEASHLRKRGVSDGTADELAARFPADFIRHKIEVFDWMVGKQDKRVSTSPAGYLVKSIADDYAAPKGFLSEAERQRREDARRESERREAEQRRRKQAADDQTRRENERVAAYWEGLSDEQKAAHDAAAVAQADAEELELIQQPGPLKRLGMTILRDDYTRKLLRLPHRNG